MKNLLFRIAEILSRLSDPRGELNHRDHPVYWGEIR